MSFFRIIFVLLVSAVLAYIAYVPLKHAILVVAHPKMLSYRKANLRYRKFYVWITRQHKHEQIIDWITLFPIWGYIFYIIGQIGRWLFARRDDTDAF